MSGAAVRARGTTQRTVMRRLCATALAGTVFAGHAAAQDRPLLLPERDVAVAYRGVDSAPGAREVEVSYLAAEKLQRFELGSGLGAFVADHKNLGESFTIFDWTRTVTPVLSGPTVSVAMPGMPDRPTFSGRFTRTGDATYAGLVCTVWRYEDEKENGEACITADGVPLRGFGTRRGHTFGLEATRVDYGPQDSTRFRRPDGYRVVLPEGYDVVRRPAVRGQAAPEP